jgi:hypothetical protein
MKTKTEIKGGLWNLIAAGAIVATTLIAPSAAFAEKVDISGKHSREEIAEKCKAVGGVGVNTKGTSGGYGCENLDKGTSVDCDANGKCTGWVPARVTPGTRKNFDAVQPNNMQTLQ